MRNTEARLRQLEAVLQVRESDFHCLSDAELAALVADAVRAMGPDERASFAATMARFPAAYGSAADPEAIERLLAGEVEAYLARVPGTPAA